MGRDKATARGRRARRWPCGSPTRCATPGPPRSSRSAVTPPPSSRSGCRSWPTTSRARGPFPATLTALRHAATDVVVVLSCDLLAPEPGAPSARWSTGCEAAAPDVVAAVPVVDGHHQWTHAAWRRAALGRRSRRPGGAGVGSLRRACADLAARASSRTSPAADLADADRACAICQAAG